jgi:hypothetical protein
MIDNIVHCEDVFGFLIETDSVDKKDYHLFASFNSQTARNIGFTDRQYELAKRKIDDYAQALAEHKLDPQALKNNLRLPIREIDRSRYIKIVDNDGQKLIEIRFTFSKKLISCIERLRKEIARDTNYNSTDKTHHFPYSEQALYKIVDIFKDKNFVLDETVEKIYNTVKDWAAEDFVPGVYNGEVKNLNTTALKYIEAEIGKYSAENAYLYLDRKFKYGLSNFDTVDLIQLDILSQKIVQRNTSHVVVNSGEHTLNKLIESLYVLQRFPTLFLVNENDCIDNVFEIYDATKNLVEPQQQSVMFRLSNQSQVGVHFNTFLKNNNLNGKLDTDKNIVYSYASNVPKPLIKSDWTPRCIVLYKLSMHDIKRAIEFFGNNDLVIHYDTELNSMARYYYKQDVQEL